jgi:hypothetical protein
MELMGWGVAFAIVRRYPRMRKPSADAVAAGLGGGYVFIASIELVKK